jgi:hypothetical protein
MVRDRQAAEEVARLSQRRRPIQQHRHCNLRRRMMKRRLRQCGRFTCLLGARMPNCCLRVLVDRHRMAKDSKPFV